MEPVFSLGIDPNSYIKENYIKTIEQIPLYFLPNDNFVSNFFFNFAKFSPKLKKGINLSENPNKII